MHSMNEYCLVPVDDGWRLQLGAEAEPEDLPGFTLDEAISLASKAAQQSGKSAVLRIFNVEHVLQSVVCVPRGVRRDSY